jgi:hypothetical protein
MAHLKSPSVGPLTAHPPARATGRRALPAMLLVAALGVSSFVETAARVERRGPPAFIGDRLELTVLSSHPEQVSGDDALIRVAAPRTVPLHQIRVYRNGDDVTSGFAPVPGEHAIAGLVDGLSLGWNTLEAFPNGRGQGRPQAASLQVKNHPITGPIFSGPQQYPFVCKTERPANGLGQPLVDNLEGEGFPVFAVNDAGEKTDLIIGWSRDCSAPDRVDYMYRTTGGQWLPLPPGPDKPSDLAQTTLMDGRTVDYIVRWERGTINRFVYSMAMLAPFGEDPANPDRSSWNRRTIYSFQGGVAIGKQQGEISQSAALQHDGLSLGYAVLYSTANRTGVHYNLQVGGETALMVKETFIERHGVPYYTIGVGGSGGGLQQYVYAQNHPGLLDGGVPQYSYPDMVTQTIHIGDCELLEHYMDVTDGANPKWQIWSNRSWLQGLNAEDDIPNPYRGGLPGNTECINGWRGLAPLAMNPLFGSAGAGQELMFPPGVMLTVTWTHWEDLRNIYGLAEDGWARPTWDNVGVQYGLRALRDGNITPAEFLHLNANVGGWKHPSEMIQEGCPFISALCADPAQFDPWSRRNMALSPDGGITPAPRTEGNLEAMRAAYLQGMVFDGQVDIPMIDWRHYLEHRLDMHNTHQSFATRQRIIERMGHHENQVVWFTDARPLPAWDQTPEAFEVLEEWITTLKTHPGLTVGQAKPAGAVDSCFDTAGSLIAQGGHVWDGILNDDPPGPCTEAFPLYSTSRIVAGGPLKGGIYKCHLKSVDQAIADGTYGEWVPSAEERDRLMQIFPTGVCDYSQPDMGRPVD